MRLKIIAGNVIAVLVVGLISYWVVNSSVKESFAAELNSRVTRDQRLFERSFQVSANKFVEEAESRASTNEVRAVFRAINERSRRESAYGQAEAINRWFRDAARGRGTASPDIVAITGSHGDVIARDKDINRRPPLMRQMSALRETLRDGRARHDVWHYPDEDKLIEIAVAPIRSEEGQLLGALVVGYDLVLAVQEEADVLGRELAFIREGGNDKPTVYSSTLSQPDQLALTNTLGEEHAPIAQAALSGRSSTPWSASLSANEYVAVLGRLPMAESSPVAYAVLGNRTQAVKAADVTYMILLMMLFGIIVVVIYGFIIGTSFTRPLEEIEEAVLGVINGRTDLRIDIESPEFGGLAYRINQLINVFTGVAEEDDQGRVSSAEHAWQGSAYGDAKAPAQQAVRRSAGSSAPSSDRDPIDDPDVARSLAAEDEGAYHERIYREYVEAKSKVGEDVSNIPQDRFVKRLQANAQALAKQHACKMVRFQVQSANGQVVLRPVIIR